MRAGFTLPGGLPCTALPSILVRWPLPGTAPFAYSPVATPTPLVRHTELPHRSRWHMRATDVTTLPIPTTADGLRSARVALATHVAGVFSVRLRAPSEVTTMLELALLLAVIVVPTALLGYALGAMVVSLFDASRRHRRAIRARLARHCGHDSSATRIVSSVGSSWWGR